MTRLRYILSIIVALTLALPAIDAQNFAPAAQAQEVVVKGDNVNLRTGPGLNYGSHAKVNRGTHLPYNYSTGVWYCVTYEGHRLYIREDYVEFIHKSASNSLGKKSDPIDTFVNVTGDGVRLRSVPDRNGAIKAKVNKGTRLRYVSTHGEWFCVMYKGEELYISRDFANIAK